MNAFGVLLGAVLYLPIEALLHVLFALCAFPDAFAQLVVAMDVPIVLGCRTYGDAAPAFGMGYGAPLWAGLVAVFLSEFVSHGMSGRDGRDEHTLTVFLSHGIKRDMSVTVPFAGFTSVVESGAGKASEKPI